MSGTAEVSAQGTNVSIIIYCVLKGAPNLMCVQLTGYFVMLPLAH